jgi:hypothetical protein
VRWLLQAKVARKATRPVLALGLRASLDEGRILLKNSFLIEV